MEFGVLGVIEDHADITLVVEELFRD